MQDTASTLGSRIKALRKARALTQANIAEFVGVSKAAVSQWELDIAEPQGENLVRLAECLGVHPSALLWGSGPAASAPILEPRLLMALSCLETELGARFLGLPVEQRSKLITYVYNRGEPMGRPELTALLGLLG